MNKIDAYAARTKASSMSVEELKDRLTFFLTTNAMVGYDLNDLDTLYADADEVEARLVTFDNLQDMIGTSPNRSLQKLHMLIKADNQLDMNTVSKIAEQTSAMPSDIAMKWGLWIDNSTTPQILTLSAYRI